MNTRLWIACRRLKRSIERERRRQERIEAKRARENGVYDPLLGKWVPKELRS